MRILLLEPKHLGGLANIWGGGAVPPGPNVEPPLVLRSFFCKQSTFYSWKISLLTNKADLVISERKWWKSCLLNPTFQNLDEDVWHFEKVFFKFAKSERSFTILRRLKTWFRNSMGEERLTASAIMNKWTFTETFIWMLITYWLLRL